MKVLRNQKGLTLVEMIVALAILSLIVVIFVNAFGHVFGNIIGMGNKTQAVAEAQAIIDFVYERGEADQSVLMSNFDIKDRVSYNELRNQSYDPAKPIYYSISNEEVDSVTKQRITVLVYYRNGNRSTILSSLIP